MDLTAAVTAVEGASGHIETIGLAVLGVVAVMFGFKMAKAAISR